MQEQRKLPLRVIETGSLFWRPREDINTWELAQALPVLLLTDEHIRAQMFSDLPPNVSRHFGYKMRALR